MQVSQTPAPLVRVQNRLTAIASKTRRAAALCGTLAALPVATMPAVSVAVDPAQEEAERYFPFGIEEAPVEAEPLPDVSTPAPEYAVEFLATLCDFAELRRADHARQVEQLRIERLTLTAPLCDIEEMLLLA